MWFRQLAKAWHIDLVPNNANVAIRLSAPTLSLENKGALDMAHASGPTKRTKHIDFKHHYIQEQVHTRALPLRQIPTAAQLADIFTKPLKRVLLQTMRLSSTFGPPQSRGY